MAGILRQYQKVCCGFIFLFMFLVHGQAQQQRGWFAEVSLLRYAAEYGILEGGYQRELHYINAFNIGYTQHDRLRYSVGLRRVNTSTSQKLGYVFDDSNLRGIEVRTSIDYSVFSYGRASILTGLDLFGEFSTVTGEFSADYPGTYIVHHKRHYLGFAPKLTCSIRILEKVFFFASIRYRIGKARHTRFGGVNSNYMYYPDQSFWIKELDPLNALGLNFSLN